MAVRELTADNFEQVVTEGGIVLVDWWAPWCGPCRMFAPIYEAAAERHGQVVWAKVNTDEQSELAEAFGIQSIPTLMAFRDGILVFGQPGLLPEQALDRLVQEVEGLDMNEVRRQAAEHERKVEAEGA
jgi:thioredoxin